MTLIVSHLDRNGIVLATDSNLTDDEDRFARVSRKNFELPHLRGGLSIAGCWSVNGNAMDEWMPRFIVRPETYEGRTLAGFVAKLRSALQFERTEEERKEKTIIHVAGYELDSTLGFHPVHWTIWNVSGLDEQGNYLPAVAELTMEEHFWDRDCQQKDSPTGFTRAWHVYSWQTYANGYEPGRIAYMGVRHHVERWLPELWKRHGEPGWHFRPPKSLDESIKLARLYMGLVNGLFEVSDALAPYIGGEVQIIGIPLPTPQGTR
jgi:hypothetical protein